MTTELRKRIITSIVLITIAVLCISINTELFMISSIVFGMICFMEWGKINTKSLMKKKPLKSFLIIVSGFIYLFIILQISIFALRGESLESIIFFIIILCICSCSDIGGYVFGKTIGGKKLTSISPNKTISGSIGSFIFSILPLFLFNFQNYFDSYFDLDLKTYTFFTSDILTNEYEIFNFEISLKNILFCLIISLSCQLGDLFISYIKRFNNVKDAGTILPGHGGLLDRVDGIIFAIPTGFILIFTQMF